MRRFKRSFNYRTAGAEFRKQSQAATRDAAQRLLAGEKGPFQIESGTASLKPTDSKPETTNQ